MMLRSVFVFLVFVAIGNSLPVVCYYEVNVIDPSNAPYYYCDVFILIGSAHLDNAGFFKVNLTDVEQFSRLRNYRHDLKLLVTVLSSNPTFSHLTSTRKLMETFARETTAFLKDWNLDGIDLDWEFPTWSSDSKPTDRAQLGNLMEILHRHYKPAKKLLSIAVSGPPTITRMAYDVQAIGKYADMVQVMNYDFHVFHPLTNPLVGFNAPLDKMDGEISVLGEMNSKASMNTWFELGLPRNKTYFGIPIYARAYQLLNQHLHVPYSPAVRTLDQYTNFDKVCKLLKSDRFTKVFDIKTSSPYAYGQGIWVSYENKRSILFKTMYARSLGIAGIMVFSVTNDDVYGKCRYREYPLLYQIHKNAKHLRDEYD